MNKATSIVQVLDRMSNPLIVYVSVIKPLYITHNKSFLCLPRFAFSFVLLSKHSSVYSIVECHETASVVDVYVSRGVSEVFNGKVMVRSHTLSFFLSHIILYAAIHLFFSLLVYNSYNGMMFR